MSKSVVATGTTRRVVMQGLGGISKSMLATTVARDCEVGPAFPDAKLYNDVATWFLKSPTRSRALLRNLPRIGYRCF